MMIKWRLSRCVALGILAVGLTLGVVPVEAAGKASVREEGLAAVVNEAAISQTDVTSRTSLALLSAGLPKTAAMRAHLRPQVLQALIDEQLQVQEARRLGLNVSGEEIDGAIARLGRENHVPGDDLAAFVAKHDVPVAALRAQAYAALMWSKVVQREIRPRVEVSDAEIDEAMARARARAGQRELLISEIDLPLHTPSDEESALRFARDLRDRLAAKEVSFSAAAQQFSRGAGAALGGDLGWVQMNQMPPELAKALEGAEAGQLIGPVRAASSVYLLGVRDVRVVDPSKVTRTELLNALGTERLYLAARRLLSDLRRAAWIALKDAPATRDDS